MGIAVFLPGERLQFDYLNHRGVLERRDVIFKGLDYGENEWYPEPQWFMRCHDLVRDADRSFALARIEGAAIVRVHNGLVEVLDRLVGKPFELPLPQNVVTDLTAAAGHVFTVSHGIGKAGEELHPFAAPYGNETSPLSRETAPYFVLFREGSPRSPMVKEGAFFRSQGGNVESWGESWAPIDATSIGDARRKCAAAHGVTLSPIYEGEE